MDEVAFDFVLAVTGEAAMIALVFLDVQMLLPDVHGQSVVPSHALTAIRAYSHLRLSRHLSIRIVNVLLVKGNLEVRMGLIAAFITRKIPDPIVDSLDV